MAEGQGRIMIARLARLLRRSMTLEQRLAEYERRDAQYHKRLRRGDDR